MTWADMIFVGTVETVRGRAATARSGRRSRSALRWLAWEKRRCRPRRPAGGRRARSRWSSSAVRTATSNSPSAASAVQDWAARAALRLRRWWPGLARGGRAAGLWTLDVRGARDELGEYLRVTSEGRLTRGATGSGLMKCWTRSTPYGRRTVPTEPVARGSRRRRAGDRRRDTGTAGDDEPERARTSSRRAEPGQPETEEPQTGAPADRPRADDPELESSSSDAATDDASPPSTDTQIVVNYAWTRAADAPALHRSCPRRAGVGNGCARLGLVRGRRRSTGTPEAGSATHSVAYGDPNLSALTHCRSPWCARATRLPRCSSHLPLATCYPVLLHELGVWRACPKAAPGSWLAP